MSKLWAIAAITYKEGIRNRALYGISILAVLLLAANQLICSMIPRDVGKVSVDLSLSAVAFAGLLVVLFVGINLMAKDLDRKTIYMVLSRPVSRAQYLVGKFIGLALIISVSMALLGACAAASIFLTKLNYPTFFDRFGWSGIFTALVFSTLMLLLLAALSFLFASFASNSFVTLVLTVATYLIGQVTGDVKALVEAPAVVGIQVSAITTALVKSAYYVFPNLALFDLKIQAAHGLPVTGSYMVWTVCYWCFYLVMALTLATLIFRKREFP
jgi:ABC-type transport system involved in multi-copper enzyme maturation permease subunit